MEKLEILEASSTKVIPCFHDGREKKDSHRISLGPAYIFKMPVWSILQYTDDKICLSIKVSNGSEIFKRVHGGFPGGTVVKNPPANAGDMGSSPGPVRSHMPRSN